MKIQTVVTSLIFFTASALSMASSVISFGDGDKSATPALLGASTALILIGLLMAVILKSRNNRPRRDLGN